MKTITLNEWNNATTEERAAMLMSGVQVRSEDHAELREQAFPNSRIQIKKRKLSEWKSVAARKCAEAKLPVEHDAANAEFQRAKAAYEEHCREFGLVAYATYDAD